MENVEQCPYCGNYVAGVEKSASGKGWIQGAATAAGAYFGIPMAGQAAGYAVDAVAGKNLVFQCPKCGHSWSRKAGESVIPDELVEVSRKKALEYYTYNSQAVTFIGSLLGSGLVAAIPGVITYFTYSYCKNHDYMYTDTIHTILGDHTGQYANWWWYINAFICFFAAGFTLIGICLALRQVIKACEKEAEKQKHYDYIKSLTTAQYRHSSYMKQFPYDK